MRTSVPQNAWALARAHPSVTWERMKVRHSSPRNGFFLARALRPFLALIALVAMISALPACQRYDSLIEKDQIAAQKWADLEAQLQRRYDLVPNLVAVVKGSGAY